MYKLLVILGPTATGKTDLALGLAHKFNAELISADSRQVYQGLDIGSGKKPSADLPFKVFAGRWEVAGIPIYLYDVVSPRQQFTVKEYVDLAQEKVQEISRSGKLPIIIGGTGFYIKALLEGLPNLQIPVDEKLRGELQGLSKEQLQQKLKEISIARWNNLNRSDRQNPRRLLRSIELVLMNPYAKIDSKTENLKTRYSVLKIGLTAPREVLKNRIFRRLLRRLDEGLVAEGENLLRNEITLQRMRELGLEYRYLADYLEGDLSREQFINTLATKIGQYAKRQLTWFNKDSEINWFDITSPDWQGKVEKLVSIWYDYNHK